MDYIEAFKNLRTNNKWGRKSPHKAVLMLTVIEMFEQNVLTNNEIYYDEQLKEIFLKIWNKVLPEEPLFHPEAYLPFWFLQSDSFWHIVPIRGKEDILSLMRDNHVKPSEAKLIDSVRYAELDDDLYFMMTIPSGRTSMKRALLETYTSLADDQIDSYSESSYNTTDYSTSALSDYEKIISHEKDITETNVNSDNDLMRQYLSLNEDIQITLNLQYYTFMKSHRLDREMFKEVCPTVYDLLDRIVNHPVKHGDFSPSFTFVYDSFLSDLRVSLMSDDGSLDLIDKINVAIEILHGNCKDNVEELLPFIKENESVQSIAKDDYSEKSEIVKTKTDDDSSNSQKIILNDKSGKRWSTNEDELIVLFYKQGKDTNIIAERLGRKENEVKSRLFYLGLVNQDCNQENSFNSITSQKKIGDNNEEYKIENSLIRCSIFNSSGLRIFSSDGKLKYIDGRLYRINLKEECFTLKSMSLVGSKWVKGEKKIVAYPNTDLYKVLDKTDNYLDLIEDIIDNPVFEDCQLMVNGIWYKYNGYIKSVPHTDKPMRIKNEEIAIQKIKEKPYYNDRKQAILFAMSFFRLPVGVKDIARTISRTVWGSSVIEESEVEKIIHTLSEVENVDGKYILKKRR